jgi:hypothetical protein
MTVFGGIVILLSSAFLTKANRDLAFEPTYLDVEPRLHQFNVKK